MNHQFNDPSNVSIKTLCQSIELGAQVLQRVAGNAVANSLDGVQLGPNTYRDLVAARLQNTLTQPQRRL